MKTISNKIMNGGIMAFVVFAIIAVCSMQVYAISDPDLTAAVKEKISSNKETANSKIDVNTSNGIVSLSGNVQSEKEASAAIETASSVVGVQDVNSDQLTVKNSLQPYKDAYITAKVKGAFVREKLFGDKPISVTSISVETKDGVVTLAGDATATQAQDAVSLVKAINGVKDVVSNIKAQ